MICANYALWAITGTDFFIALEHPGASDVGPGIRTRGQSVHIILLGNGLHTAFFCCPGRLDVDYQTIFLYSQQASKRENIMGVESNLLNWIQSVL